MGAFRNIYLNRKRKIVSASKKTDVKSNFEMLTASSVALKDHQMRISQLELLEVIRKWLRLVKESLGADELLV